MIENDLYKARSFAGCIRAAYQLTNGNVKTLLGKTWLPALVCAMLWAGATLYAMQLASPLLPEAATKFVAFWGLAILGLAAYGWFTAKLLTLLNGHPLPANLRKVAGLYLLVFALSAVGTLVCMAPTIADMATAPPPQPAAPSAEAAMGQTATPHTSYALWGTMVLVVLAIVAAIPLQYSSMKYLMTPKLRLLSIVGKPYLHGMRRWGFLFMVTLLCLLISGCLGWLASLPLFVLQVAQGVNQAGLALGDASDLPGYFYPLAFCAGTVSNFITIYIMAWGLFASFYAYGSIEARNKTKAQEDVHKEENV